MGVRTMIGAVEHIFEDYDQGRIGRREAMVRLGTLVAMLSGAGASVATAEQATTFRTTGVGHIALRVTDLERSKEFYQRHLGLSVLRSGPSNCFLGAGEDDFLALFRSETAGLDHYCYQVQDFDATDAVDRLESAGLGPRRREDRVYFEDPDGLTVQVSGKRDSRPG